VKQALEKLKEINPFYEHVELCSEEELVEVEKELVQFTGQSTVPLATILECAERKNFVVLLK